LEKNFKVRKGALESCAAWKPGSTTYREVHAAGLGWAGQGFFTTNCVISKIWGFFFSQISWISTRKHKNFLHPIKKICGRKKIAELCTLGN
jgi:hypothetical protein